MKQIAKVLVGSRLHGLHNDDSDYDYRGIHIHDLRDKLSPFQKLKNTTWIEGEKMAGRPGRASRNEMGVGGREVSAAIDNLIKKYKEK